MDSKYEPCEICMERDDYNPEFCNGCVFDLRHESNCGNPKCRYQENGRCGLGLRCKNCKAHIYEEGEPHAHG